MPAVGNYLQGRRNAAGLTQEAVARQLGVVAKTVSDWEAGRYSPGFDLMVQLLRIINGRIEVAARLLLDDEEPLTSDVKQRIEELEETEEGRAALVEAARRYLDEPPHQQ